MLTLYMLHTLQLVFKGNEFRVKHSGYSTSDAGFDLTHDLQ